MSTGRATGLGDVATTSEYTVAAKKVRVLYLRNAYESNRCAIVSVPFV